MDCKNGIEWGTVAQWAGAFATSCAVLVALFKDSVKSWLNKPELQLEALPLIDNCFLSNVSDGNNNFEKRYYIRVRIINNGTRTAKNVKVFVAGCEKENASGKFIRRPDFQPMKLVWTHTGKNECSTIEPEIWNHCELGQILLPGSINKLANESVKHIPNTETSFILDTEVKPFTGSSFFEKGKYKFTLEVVSDDTKKKSYKLVLNHVGLWFDDATKMYNEGFGITIES
jgi:hypothetical protein